MKRNKEESSRSLRHYPFLLGILCIVILSGVAQVMVFLDCFFPILVLDPEAVSNVMSTCSEVVAGLYGITLTGYIFFADRFQNTSQNDESLYDAVQALLIRYNHMAGIISVMCLVCIVFAEGIVLYGTNQLLPLPLYRFIVNETLLIFFWTFNFILYFVISVLDPHKVSRISSHKKEKISADKTAGDPEQFLADYTVIEEQVSLLWDNLVKTIRFVPGAHGKNKPQIVHMLENLRNYRRINHTLWRKLDKLRQYHNLTLHDPEMMVSQEMCSLAAEVLTELKSKTDTLDTN